MNVPDIEDFEDPNQAVWHVLNNVSKIPVPMMSLTLTNL